MGTVRSSGNSIPNKYDESSKIIHILNMDGYPYRLFGWNGKWLYMESGQLVSHKEISKYDLNKALYGKVSLDSDLYDILGFKKGKVDQYETVVNTLPDEKK